MHWSAYKGRHVTAPIVGRMGGGGGGWGGVGMGGGGGGLKADAIPVLLIGLNIPRRHSFLEYRPKKN